MREEGSQLPPWRLSPPEQQQTCSPGHACTWGLHKREASPGLRCKPAAVHVPWAPRWALGALPPPGMLLLTWQGTARPRSSAPPCWRGWRRLTAAQEYPDPSIFCLCSGAMWMQSPPSAPQTLQSPLCRSGCTGMGTGCWDGERAQPWGHRSPPQPAPCSPGTRVPCQPPARPAGPCVPPRPGGTQVGREGTKGFGDFGSCTRGAAPAPTGTPLAWATWGLRLGPP